MGMRRMHVVAILVLLLLSLPALGGSPCLKGSEEIQRCNITRKVVHDGAKTQLVVEPEGGGSIGNLDNLTTEGGYGFLFEKNRPLFQRVLNSSKGTTYGASGMCCVASTDSISAFSYVREEAEAVSFWLRVFHRSLGIWDTPIMVDTFEGVDEGKAVLFIDNTTIHYGMAVKNSLTGWGELHLKTADTDNWAPISDVADQEPDKTGITTTDIAFSRMGKGTALFWTRSTGDLFMSKYSSGVWGGVKKVTTGVGRFVPLFAEGRSTIHLITVDPNGRYINHTYSVDGGSIWSPLNTIVFENIGGLSSIDAVYTGEKLLLTYIDQERLSLDQITYDITDGWSESSGVTDFLLNDLDDLQEHQMVYDGTRILIVYENGPGRLSSLFSSDQGRSYIQRSDLGDGMASSPMLGEGGEFLLFYNGTGTEVHRYVENMKGTLRTQPLSPLGLRKWGSIGFQLSGFEYGGKALFRILSGDGTRQVYPETGYIDVTGLDPGSIYGVEMDRHTDLQGEWTEGNLLEEPIILEVFLQRFPGHVPVLESITINFTTALPAVEDFSRPSRMIKLENCLLTAQGLALSPEHSTGEAIFGPLYAEEGWPDAVGLIISSPYIDVSARMELLGPDMMPIIGYDIESSSVADDLDKVNYIKWNGVGIGELTDTINTIFVRVEIRTGSVGVVPIVRSITFDRSLPPEIVSFTSELDWIFRGETARFDLVVSDREDRPNEMMIDAKHRLAGSDEWSDRMISGSIWTGGKWAVEFMTDPSTPIGSYEFLVQAEDTSGNRTPQLISQFTLKVKNNPPTRPLGHIQPGVLTTGDNVTVVLDKLSTDIETPGDILYNYRFLRSGLPVEEELGTRNTSCTLSGFSPVKGVKWHVEVTSFDGVNESEPLRMDFEVVNSRPEVIWDGGAIHLEEDSAGLDLSFDEFFFDKDGDELMVDAFVSGGLSLNLTGDGLTVSPQPDFNGKAFLRLTCSDGEKTSSIGLDVTVEAVDDPPILSLPENITANEDSWTLIVPRAEDPRDGQKVNVTTDILSSVPGTFEGVNVKTNPNGSFLFRPDNSMVGTHRVNVTASDGNLTASGEIAIRVINVNDPPRQTSITIEGGKVFTEGDEITLRGDTYDPDQVWGDRLDYVWESSIQGFIGNGENITPTLKAGSHNITLTVTDMGGRTDECLITIEVLPEKASLERTMRTTTLFILIAVAAIIIGVLVAALIAYLIRRSLSGEGEKSTGKGENKDGEGKVEENDTQGKGGTKGNNKGAETKDTEPEAEMGLEANDTTRDMEKGKTDAGTEKGKGN